VFAHPCRAVALGRMLPMKLHRHNKALLPAGFGGIGIILDDWRVGLAPRGAVPAG